MRGGALPSGCWHASTQAPAHTQFLVQEPRKSNPILKQETLYQGCRKKDPQYTLTSHSSGLEPGLKPHGALKSITTENQGANDEGPVPVVLPGHGGDTKEDEDKGLADAAPHLQEIFDGCVGLVGDIGLHIRAHHHPCSNQPARKRDMGYGETEEATSVPDPPEKILHSTRGSHLEGWREECL
ncbi:hypothetical protein L345_04219, partial [Ophiophagus hannah]